MINDFSQFFSSRKSTIRNHPPSTRSWGSTRRVKPEDICFHFIVTVAADPTAIKTFFRRLRTTSVHQPAHILKQSENSAFFGRPVCASQGLQTHPVTSSSFIHVNGNGFINRGGHVFTSRMTNTLVS